MLYVFLKKTIHVKQFDMKIKVMSWLKSFNWHFTVGRILLKLKNLTIEKSKKCGSFEIYDDMFHIFYSIKRKIISFNKGVILKGSVARRKIKWSKITIYISKAILFFCACLSLKHIFSLIYIYTLSLLDLTYPS